MIRPTPIYKKITMHLLCIILFSLYVTRRSTKTASVLTIKRFVHDLRHILIWTDLPGVQHEGQTEFHNLRCVHANCYFTKNRTLLEDVRYYDAIVFNLQNVSQGAQDLPKLRGFLQKYIFAANDSADNYPVCDPVYDGFFNWTWTYKQDSTLPYKFISVQTLQGQILEGEIHFRGEMKKLDLVQINQLRVKTNAAVIFLDKCKSKSKREVFLERLQMELAKYNHTVDVYGDCGPLRCRRKSWAVCNYRIRKMYFFYLALEDSMADDFITDEVLHAFKNDAVPIVSGGARYLNFLPKNSYLDVSQFNSMAELAARINEMIIHKQLYYDMFKWKQYISVEKGSVLSPCQLCEALNKPKMLMKTFSFPNFRKWWNPRFESRCSE